MVTVKKEYEKELCQLRNIMETTWHDILDIFQKTPSTDEEWQAWIDCVNDRISKEGTDSGRKLNRKMGSFLLELAEDLQRREDGKG